MEFGLGVSKAYSTVLIGFIRAAITDGSRHKAVRERIYTDGPGAITDV